MNLKIIGLSTILMLWIVFKEFIFIFIHLLYNVLIVVLFAYIIYLIYKNNKQKLEKKLDDFVKRVDEKIKNL